MVINLKCRDCQREFSYMHTNMVNADTFIMIDSIKNFCTTCNQSNTLMLVIKPLHFLNSNNEREQEVNEQKGP